MSYRNVWIKNDFNQSTLEGSCKKKDKGDALFLYYIFQKKKYFFVARNM